MMAPMMAPLRPELRQLRSSSMKWNNELESKLLQRLLVMCVEDDDDDDDDEFCKDHPQFNS